MKKHLAISLSRDGATFVSLHDSRIDQEHAISFHGFNVSVVKNQLNEVFGSVSFLGEEFDEVTLAWNTNKSTLVPNGIFAETDANAVFKLCFGDSIDSSEIDYNRFWEAGVVNVFEIPTWIKTFFVIKFPRIVIQHMGTHALRGALDSNAFNLKASLIINESYFFLSMIKHNQLQFYSFFDAQSSEDVVYHLVFALQQKELTEEKGLIELIPGANDLSVSLEEVKEGLEKIKDLSKFNINIENNFIPKAQQLCV